VAVLGSGADVIYPSEHEALATEIQTSGVVSSELAPGTPPRPYFFPLRNRIISGLARAVVVIEAGEKSGSLITARTALDQGREVLAVPGNVLTGRNRGAHALLRDGARIVESADDILEELGLSRRDQSRRESGLPSGKPGADSTDPVLGCFSPGDPLDLDELADRSGLEPARLLPRLLELELAGRIVRAGGGRFVRI
jgi:DNA processing protein